MNPLIQLPLGRPGFTDDGFDRRRFLSMVGKGIGLATLSTPSLAGMLGDLHAAAKRVDNLEPEQAASDEDFWLEIQRSFSVTRGITNLNNGGVSPSPRIMTDALARYPWEQDDSNADTML